MNNWVKPQLIYMGIKEMQNLSIRIVHQLNNTKETQGFEI